jgi:hypothetical protein
MNYLKLVIVIIIIIVFSSCKRWVEFKITAELVEKVLSRGATILMAMEEQTNSESLRHNLNI